MRPIAILLVSSISIAACAPRDDPERAALRTRLTQGSQLSQEEIGRVFEQVGEGLQGRTVRVSRGGTMPSDLGAAEREFVLGMLRDRAGVFDEGLRTGGGRRARVFNAPAVSNNPEIEATQRLFVDVETFLPLRFEYASAFPSPDDYSVDLVVN